MDGVKREGARKTLYMPYLSPPFSLHLFLPLSLSLPLFLSVSFSLSFSLPHFLSPKLSVPGGVAMEASATRGRCVSARMVSTAHTVRKVRSYLNNTRQNQHDMLVTNAMACEYPQVCSYLIFKEHPHIDHTWIVSTTKSIILKPCVVRHETLNNAIRTMHLNVLVDVQRLCCYGFTLP